MFYSCPVTCFWWYSPVRESPCSKFLLPPSKHLQKKHVLPVESQSTHAACSAFGWWCQGNKPLHREGKGCIRAGDPLASLVETTY